MRECHRQTARDRGFEDGFKGREALTASQWDGDHYADYRRGFEHGEQDRP